MDRKVLFAVAGHVLANDISFVLSAIELAKRPPCPVFFGWSLDPSVERARNILTASFLESPCTHILFCDTDIGFLPEHVDRITSHDVGVVGGLYPLKKWGPQPEWCSIALQQKQPVRPDGLMRVAYIGTGFLCIRRDVFQKIIAAIGDQLAYTPANKAEGNEFAFWRQGVRAGRFLTEDWMFCQTWIDLGGEVFADTRVMLSHAGRAEWPLPSQIQKEYDISRLKN
ncbi:MAG: hypothetical protein ABSA45_03240 [Verrucomicrobiota bacterium]